MIWIVLKTHVKESLIMNNIVMFYFTVDSKRTVSGITKLKLIKWKNSKM